MTSKTKKFVKFSNRALTGGNLDYNQDKLTVKLPSPPIGTELVHINKGKAIKYGNNFKLNTVIGTSSTSKDYSFIILGELFKEIFISGFMGIAGVNKVNIHIDMNNGFAKKVRIESANTNYSNSLFQVTISGVAYLALGITNVRKSLPVICDAIVSNESLNSLDYITDVTKFDKVEPWGMTIDGSKKVYVPFSLPYSLWYDMQAVTLSNGKVFIGGGTIGYDGVSDPSSGNDLVTDPVTTNKCFLFDPNTCIFTDAPPLPFPVVNHRMVALKNGDCISIGGSASIVNSSGVATTKNLTTFYSARQASLSNQNGISYQSWASLGEWYLDWGMPTVCAAYDDVNDYIYVLISAYDNPTTPYTIINTLTRAKVLYSDPDERGNRSATILARELVKDAIPDNLYARNDDGSINKPYLAEMVFANNKLYFPLPLRAADAKGFIFDIATNTWSKWIKTAKLSDSGNIVKYKNGIYGVGYTTQFNSLPTASQMSSVSDITPSDMIFIDLNQQEFRYKTPINGSNSLSLLENTSGIVGSSCGMTVLKDGRIAIFGGDTKVSVNSSTDKISDKKSVGYFYYPENDTGKEVFTHIASEYDGSLNNLNARSQVTYHNGIIYYIVDNSISESNPYGNNAKLRAYNISYKTFVDYNLPPEINSVEGAALTINRTTETMYFAGGIIITDGKRVYSRYTCKITLTELRNNGTWVYTGQLPEKAAFGRMISFRNDGIPAYYGGVFEDGRKDKNIYIFFAEAWNTFAALPYSITNGDMSENNPTYLGVVYGYNEDGTPNHHFTIFTPTTPQIHYDLSTLHPSINDDVGFIGVTKLNKDIFRLIDTSGRHWDFDVNKISIQPVDIRRRTFIPSFSGIIKLDSDKMVSIDSDASIYLFSLYQLEHSYSLDKGDSDNFISRLQSDITGHYSDISDITVTFDSEVSPTVIPMNGIGKELLYINMLNSKRAYNAPGLPQCITMFKQPSVNLGYSFEFCPSSYGGFGGMVGINRKGNPIIIGGSKYGAPLASTDSNNISYLEYVANKDTSFINGIYEFDYYAKTDKKILDLPNIFFKSASYFDQEMQKIYMFSGVPTLKCKYSEIERFSWSKSYVYDIDTNTLSPIADLPVALYAGAAVRKDADTILIFGGILGLANNNPDPASYPSNISHPNKQFFEYSISKNTYKEVTSEYNFIYNFNGSVNEPNVFGEIQFASNVNNAEKNEIVFWCLMSNLGVNKTLVEGPTVSKYIYNTIGQMLVVLDLDTKQFRVANTFSMTKTTDAISAPYERIVGGAFSNILPDTTGKLKMMNQIRRNTNSVFYTNKTKPSMIQDII